MTLRSLTLRRGALPLALTLALTMAACSSGGTESPGATATVVNGAVTITADDLVFDAGRIEATAGVGFTITLENVDSVPHNISIYTSEGGEEIVLGEIIDGGESTQVVVPALEAGEYYFVCDLHTTMDGPLVVTEQSL